MSVKLSDTTGDDWNGMAKMYKNLTTGVAHRPIAAILEKANALLPFSEATAIHDNGCGPGPILSRLIEDYGSTLPQDCALSASDFSQAMVERVLQTKEEQTSANPSSPWCRVSASVLNAMDLQGISDASLSHVTAGWVYFMTPDPQKCLAESLRVLKPAGVLALSSWKESQWMEAMNLASQIRPELTPMEIPAGWQSAAGLRRELEVAGFRDVEAVELPVEMEFESHAALADLVVGMPLVRTLTKGFDEEERRRLRDMTLENLREAAPEEPGLLHGTALVAVGRK